MFKIEALINGRTLLSSLVGMGSNGHIDGLEEVTTEVSSERSIVESLNISIIHFILFINNYILFVKKLMLRLKECSAQQSADFLSEKETWDCYFLQSVNGKMS